MDEIWTHDPKKGSDWQGYALRIAIGFPGDRSAGTACLGFLWAQHLFNLNQEVRCDRFFKSDRQLKKGERLTAVETGRPLSDYDVVAFSLPYENGFAEVPLMLSQGGVEPAASRRSRGPLVLAGGMAASANPEPVADFVDAVVIGEAEPAVGALTDALLSLKRARASRNYSLEGRERLRGLPGVYLPADYVHIFGGDGKLEAIEATAPGAPEIVEALRADRGFHAAHSTVVSRRSAFPGMFLLETARGCPYRCRFCLAAHTSGPHRPAARLVETAALGLRRCSRIGLIGTAFTKAPGAPEVCEMAAAAGTRVSFSSVRLDSETLGMLSRMAGVLDLESISVAPEVATKKLARVIGKDVSGDFEEFIRSKPLPGLKKLRLYYLIGVPGETDEDIEAIAETAADAGRRSNCSISISATPMIPKPFTPMQWAAMPEMFELKRKRDVLRRVVSNTKRVDLKVESLKGSVEQAILARGDRRLGGALLEAAVNQRAGGGTRWMALIDKYAPGAAEAVFFERGSQERFPWGTLSHGAERKKLRAEFEKAMRASRENEEI
ncbi:MAG TPA: hypothetical protein PLS19_03260 [bacterium]|nr:hypothetical protein [bacterium]HPN93562.1 hypothetical protein [bacterium]